MKDIVLETEFEDAAPAEIGHVCPWCFRQYSHGSQYMYPGDDEFDVWVRLIGENLAAEVCNRCIEEMGG